MTLTPEQQAINQKILQDQVKNSGFTYDSGSTIYVNGTAYRPDGTQVGEQPQPGQSPQVQQPDTKTQQQQQPAPITEGLSGGNMVGEVSQPTGLWQATLPQTPTISTPTKMYSNLTELRSDLGREYQPGDRVYGVAPFSALGAAEYVDKIRYNTEVFDYSQDWARYDSGLEMRPETGYTGPTAPSNGAIALSQALSQGENKMTSQQAAAIAGMDVEYRGSYSGLGGVAAVGLAATIEAAIAAMSAPVIETPSQKLSPPEQAIADVTSRPGFTDISALGDKETRRLVEVGGIQDLAAETGIALEQQRQAALLTPGTRDDQYFANELQKWTENKVELSAAYHSIGMKGDIPIAANPYEYSGDLALALLKAGNPKDFTQQAYGYNKDVDKMISLLPGGKGLQETSWNVARDGLPARGSFLPAITVLSQSEGLYGVYGDLAGGKKDTRSAFEGINIPTASGSYGEKATNSPLNAIVPGEYGAGVLSGMNPLIVSAGTQAGATGGVNIDWASKKPFLSTVGTPSTPAKEQSIFDTIGKGFGDFQKDASDRIYSGYGSLFGLTGDQARLGVRLAGISAETMGDVAPIPQNLGMAGGIGVLQDTMDQPVKAGIMAAVGFGLGAGFKTIDVVGSRAAAVAINKYPLITRGYSAVSAAFPTVMGGLYAADVGIRSTDGLSNFGAGSIARRSAGIIVTEVAPITAGGIAGYRAADSVLTRVPSLYTVPGETQIIAKAKPADLEATKATLDIFKNVNKVESPMRNAPDLTKVSGVRDNAAGVESIIKSQDPTVYGRSVEIGQMPENWINARGVTKDVDYFTPRPTEAGKAIAKAYPTDYVPKTGGSGELDYTALMSPKTGQTALDIHPYPEGYAGGTKVGFESPRSDYVKAQIDPIPGARDILKTEGLPQEKLFVQTRRKATSVLGERPGEFGPPEHRMKDVVDLLNYDSYLGQQTSGLRRMALEKDFGILKDYYTRPEVFGAKTPEGKPRYLEGEKYADIIRKMEFGKPTEGVVEVRGTGLADVRFSEVPSKYPTSYGSFFGKLIIPPPSRSPSPKKSKTGKSTSSRSTSPSPFISIPPVISPSPSPRSQSPSPFIHSPIVSPSTRSTPSPSLIPSPFSIPSPSPSPGNKSPTTPYVPPKKDTPSITPPPPRTPSPVPFKDTPSIPPPSPPPKYPDRYTPPPPTPPSIIFPGLGGNGSLPRGQSPRRYRNVFQIGLDISTFGASRPTLQKSATYKSPVSPGLGRSVRIAMPKQPKISAPFKIPGVPNMRSQKRNKRRK
jgi:hypothetical protein